MHDPALDRRTPALPEIDPELAAMEAEMAAAHGDEPVSVDAGTLQRILAGLRNKKHAVKSTGAPAKAGRDNRHKAGYDRQMRRAVERGAEDYTPDRSKSPHARLGRAKPKQDHRFAVYEYKMAMRQQLSKIKLTMLLTECPEIKFVVGVPGLRNVWQLSQATTATVHAIPGFGPKRREAVRKYLVGRRVPCSWEA